VIDRAQDRRRARSPGEVRATRQLIESGCAAY
jgi:hypothetical protein